MKNNENKISAKIIADSCNEFNNRITTMVVTFPRIILAEFNTHRMFSRNSASSRAIPFEKMVESVKTNPFIPIAWQKDHKGMQGNEYLNWFKECKVWNNQLTDFEILNIKDAWLDARDEMVEVAKNLNESDVTKQLCNRLLEPFMWHTVIVTATEWENFFALRCPRYEIPLDPDDQYIAEGRSWKDLMSWTKNNMSAGDFDTTDVIERLKWNKGQAEIHMMALAECMWDAMNESTPKQLKAGEWHIPFGDNILIPGLNGIEQNTIDTIKIATARCARVSYTVVGEEGKEPNYENDIKLHDRLATSGHWSPFEHCARAMNTLEKNVAKDEITNAGWSGNFKGFIQYRKTFNNENITK